MDNKFENIFFHVFFLGNGLKQIPIWNCMHDELQLMESKVVLPKSIPMNHCH
jgi:hypothetical protein